MAFNVGSNFNAAHSTTTVLLNGLGLSDVEVEGESLYMVTLDLTGPTPVASNLHQIATGIRNVFGMQFDSQGNLWFSDNAIDAPSSLEDPPQAEELNMITAAQLQNGIVPNFGFPDCYTQLDGSPQGAGCTPPIAAFVPYNGGYSQGSTQIVFAPPGLPEPFNDGIFIGFTGRGGADPRNPVIYYDFDTQTYLHFIVSGSTGNAVGLLATNDSLFVADWGTGEIFQITAAVPEPASLGFAILGLASIFYLRRRSAKQ
jgi:glucose/arabinose dehydrogenase